MNRKIEIVQDSQGVIKFVQHVLLDSTDSIPNPQPVNFAIVYTPGITTDKEALDRLTQYRLNGLKRKLQLIQQEIAGTQYAFEQMSKQL